MAKQFQRKTQDILGFNKQQLIRFFFGSNAFLSIVILALICIFLARDAIKFFPAHHQDLERFRKSGQEYVHSIIAEMDAYSRQLSRVNQAYFQELDARFGRERSTLEAFEELSGEYEEAGEEAIDAWAEAKDALEDEAEDAELQAEVAKGKQVWNELVEGKISSLDWSQVKGSERMQEADRALVIQALRAWDPLADAPPAEMVSLKSKMAEGMKEFEAAKTSIQAAGMPLNGLRGRLTEIARKIKEEAVADAGAQARQNALKQGAAKTSDRAQKKKLEDEAAAIVIREHFPYGEKVQALVASKAEHARLVHELKQGLGAGIAALPKEFASPAAQKLIEQVRKSQPKLERDLDKHLAAANEWQYDRPLKWSESIAHFFFGRDWVTGGSWAEFYGLLPLLTGSLMISGVALAVAIPFSLGAAIYVNRLARPTEQTLIKPTIELIQAIPSVVLGFFGIAVLGSSLQELSQVAWLSWVPGFPIQERLNATTAGLLLALMAIPTIFTLCEDALNNVPKSFAEASLALGASKVQTVLKVILPTAVSGILAAILLGFGRVIGETMVVLLVAGNQIALPDWGEGLGVLTQPTHTMTGIIAQEMPEVTAGTLHYRALFLIGLVLFCISLLINFSAQRIIKRLGHHG